MHELQEPSVNSLWNRLLSSLYNAKNVWIYSVTKILMHSEILMAFYTAAKYKKDISTTKLKMSHNWII